MPDDPPPPLLTPPPAQPPQQLLGGKGWAHFLVIEPKLSAWAAVLLIALVGIGMAVYLGWGLFAKDSIVRELASVDLARGVITFIFAVGTIGIAILLTLGALLGNQPPDVFEKAKGILTVLIGVFGTILGFYFGSAAGGAQKPPATPSTQQTAPSPTAAPTSSPATP